MHICCLIEIIPRQAIAVKRREFAQFKQAAIDSERRNNLENGVDGFSVRLVQKASIQLASEQRNNENVDVADNAGSASVGEESRREERRSHQHIAPEKEEEAIDRWRVDNKVAKAHRHRHNDDKERGQTVHKQEKQVRDHSVNASR